MCDPLPKHFYHFAHFFYIHHILYHKKCVLLLLLYKRKGITIDATLCLQHKIQGLFVFCDLKKKDITKREAFFCFGFSFMDIKFWMKKKR